MSTLTLNRHLRLRNCFKRFPNANFWDTWEKLSWLIFSYCYERSRSYAITKLRDTWATYVTQCERWEKNKKEIRSSSSWTSICNRGQPLSFLKRSSTNCACTIFRDLLSLRVQNDLISLLRKLQRWWIKLKLIAH